MIKVTKMAVVVPRHVGHTFVIAQHGYQLVEFFFTVSYRERLQILGKLVLGQNSFILWIIYHFENLFSEFFLSYVYLLHQLG